MTDPRARSTEGADRLEQAIDRAVADLVHVDPAPGLRRRVESRLAARPSRGWALFSGYGLSAAALAALVLIVGVPGRNERSDPPRPGAAPVTASRDVRSDRERVASPAVRDQRDQRAQQEAGAQASLSYPALMALPREPGATDAAAAAAVAPRRRVDRADDVARRAEVQAVAAAPPVALRNPVSPPSLQRPSERVEMERRQAMVGAALTSDAALPEPLVVPDSGAAGSRARPAIGAADVRSATRLEIRDLAVPPLEVKPLHVDPIAPTRQP